MAEGEKLIAATEERIEATKRRYAEEIAAVKSDATAAPGAASELERERDNELKESMTKLEEEKDDVKTLKAAAAQIELEVRAVEKELTGAKVVTSGPGPWESAFLPLISKVSAKTTIACGR